VVPISDSKLPSLLAVLSRTLSEVETHGGTFRCENRPSPRCQIEIAKESNVNETIHELRFATDGGRLVLAAVLHLGEVGLPDGDKARRRQWAMTRLARPRSRSCPVNPTLRPPTRATTELIRELATGLRPLAEVIDPERGLVRASTWNSGAEDYVGPAPRHLCGTELVRALPDLRRELAHLARGADGGSFECRNRPKAECTLTEAVDEYSNVHHLVFRKSTGGRVVLESWIDLDEALTSDESKAEQRRWAAELVKRARAAGCPGPSVLPTQPSLP
jgi:hypothetical protein